jgi:hypothetical protein
VAGIIASCYARDSLRLSSNELECKIVPIPICRDNTFTEFIDHIVVDPRVLPWVDRTSFRHVTYRQADKPVWNQISDHCPVLVELWIR